MMWPQSKKEEISLDPESLVDISSQRKGDISPCATRRFLTVASMLSAMVALFCLLCVSLRSPTAKEPFIQTRRLAVQTTSATAIMTKVEDVASNGATLYSGSPCWGSNSAEASGGDPTYRNEFGGMCYYDADKCVNKYKQCGILEADVEEVCGNWDLCAAVICKPSYGGYCLMRRIATTTESPDQTAYAYIKTTTSATAIMTKVEDVASNGATLYSGSPCWGSNSAEASGGDPTYRNEFGGMCYYDADKCVNKYKQCGILEADVEEVCGNWDLCAAVICKPSYGGYCLMRRIATTTESSDQTAYAYVKSSVCHQSSKLARTHERVPKDMINNALEMAAKVFGQTVSNSKKSQAYYDWAKNTCSHRGQYICSGKQQNDNCAVPQSYGASVYLAIGDPTGQTNSLYRKMISVTSQTNLLDIVHTSTPVDEETTILYSCCGEAYPGQSNQQSTKVNAVTVANADGDQKTIYVTAAHMIELMTEYGCDDSGCSATATASIGASLYAEAELGTTTIGGVPVTGTVYFEAAVEASASATMGISGEGVSITAEVGATVSVSYGVTAQGELGGGIGIESGVGVDAEAGATAAATGTCTLSEVSAEFEAGVNFGVAVSIAGEVGSDEASVSGSVGVCAGCAGAGFSPSMSVDGCSVTIGAEASVGVAIGGVEASQAYTVNPCEMWKLIDDEVAAVAKWGKNLADDVEGGLVSAAEASVAIAQDAAVWVEGFAGDAAEFFGNAGETIAGGVEDGINAFGDAAEDAYVWVSGF